MAASASPTTPEPRVEQVPHRVAEHVQTILLDADHRGKDAGPVEIVRKDCNIHGWQHCFKQQLGDLIISDKLRQRPDDRLPLLRVLLELHAAGAVSTAWDRAPKPGRTGD